MRIAMISAHSSPLAALGGKEAGGMNVYVRELSRELGRRGIAVDMFTRAQSLAVPTVVPLDHGARVINLRAGPPAPYNKNWLLTYMPEFVQGARCFAEGEDLCYDVIHSHYWLSGLAAIELRKAWGAPMVHMFHTLGALKNRVARSDDERETSERIAIEQRVAREADMLIAATPRDRADLVWHARAAREHIRVIPCGVDLERFQPRAMDVARAELGLPLAPQRIVVLVGRIEPLKGIDALIEATALLRARGTSLLALVVGGASDAEPAEWNAEQQRLAALRDELGVTDAVRFVGAQSQRLPLFYAAADIVTMPSHYESFGMAALEGLASGRPVVATSAGGPAFIVEDRESGLLTPPNDPLALAERFTRLLVDDDLRAAMGAAARRRASRFGWDIVASEVLDVYSATLAQRRRARAC